MKNKLIKIYLLIFLHLGSIYAFEVGKIQNYKFIDGLSSNSVTNIKIDEENRAWIGTYNGISMFDGVKFCIIC